MRCVPFALFGMFALCACQTRRASSDPLYSFNLIDRDHSGSITRSEWGAAVEASIGGSAGPARVEYVASMMRLFISLDENNDGVISQSEWQDGELETFQTMQSNVGMNVR